MPTAKLTKQFVDRATVPEGKSQELFWDSALKGFGLRVGAKSKVFVVQKSGGRRETLGAFGVITVEQARELAGKKLREVVSERHGGISLVTLREAADWHKERMRRKRCSPRSISDLEYRLSNYLADWLDKPLADISRRDVEFRHTRIGRRSGPYMANSVFRTFRSIYNTALKRRELPPNPCIAVEWNPERRRQEPVSDLRAWWREVRGLSPVRRSYQVFVLLTGLRRTDAATMRWDDVDFEAGTLHRPNPKGGEDRAFTIPLSRVALGILHHRQRQNEILFPASPWVFPTRNAKGEVTHLQEAKEQRQKKGRKVARLPSPHRLRDTYISAAHEAGIAELDIKVLVNHALPGGDVTAGYIRQQEDHLRRCQAAITARLLDRVKPGDKAAAKAA